MERMHRTTDDIHKIIRRACEQIRVPALADAARRSLTEFYITQMRQYRMMSFNTRLILTAFAVLSGYLRGDNAVMSKEDAATLLSRESGIPLPDIYGKSGFGQALGIWHRTYINDYVRPTLDRIAAETPRDPDDVRTEADRRNSLRNRAEMEVRYNDHLRQVEELRSSGARLVIASVHADCSERCRPWQGRVYSLDGTEGTAPDGRHFVPLEKATDVFYKTRAGKIYKNGLLGFNCRHYLIPWEPHLRFMMPTKAEAKEEYRITCIQRQMERNVRRLRAMADTYRGIDPERAKKAHKSAIEAYGQYKDFSKAHNRAYYPERVKLL